MIHRTSSGCCEKDIGSSKAHIPQTCKHNELLVYVHQLKRSAPIARTSEKKAPTGRKRALKRGKGFAASPEQRKAVRGKPCVVCGQDGYEAQVDPAHVYPRRLAACECAEGVVPMCRACHSRYDDPTQVFDLLPHLVAGRYHPELVHAVAVHEVPLSELLERVTGQNWRPLQSPTKGGR